DIWIARTRGGRARRLTGHAGYENGPVFSPDGKEIGFTRLEKGKEQVFVVPVRGGIPRQVTFHSEGSRILGFYPEGKSILISAVRDFGTRSASRFYRVRIDERKAEKLLFDAEGVRAALSPDGKKLLFTREGYDLYRKGYRGTKASQIWLAENLETPEPKFTKLISRETGARDPIWKADGGGFYYAGSHGKEGQFNLWEFDLAAKKDAGQVTEFSEDSIIAPAISADGSTIVFRREFEFYRLNLDPKEGDENAAVEPTRMNLTAADDLIPDHTVRRTLSKATNLSFSKDGLEMAFAAGGDIWVMDTILKEPKQVTNTPFEEREPVFAPDAKSIYFIREETGNMDIFKAERADPKRYFWQNDEFKETAITKDRKPKADLNFVPGGKRIAFVSGGGSLFSADPDGKNAKLHVKSWNQPDYQFSPDGKWIAYAVSDNDFNRDIWIAPVEGGRKPYNLSRHPDNDYSPRWSPDGKILAFTGRRYEKETDIYYVYLTREAEQRDSRKKKINDAIEKMKKERKAATPPPAKKPDEPKKPDPEPKKPDEPKKETPPAQPKPEPKPAAPKAEPKPEPKLAQPKADPKPAAPAKSDAPQNPKAEPPAKPKAAPKPAAKAPATPPVQAAAKKPAPATPPANKPDTGVKIEFDDLYERIRRISIKNSTEGGLFWSHDSKRLAFTGELKGVKGTYFVTFPDKLTTPALLNAKTGGLPRWDAKNDTIYWLVSGVPSTLSKGKLVSYPFKAYQEYDRREYQKAAFHQIWRTMRDNWYDENLNNTNWNALRRKYENAAANAADSKAFDRVAAMLLGELNGSHLGFRSGSSSTSGVRIMSSSSGGWTESTAHLGVWFDPHFKGPGLKILEVIENGHADKPGIDLKAGDVILKIDGRDVTPDTDLTLVLNGRSDRDIRLELKSRPEPKPKGKGKGKGKGKEKGKAEGKAEPDKEKGDKEPAKAEEPKPAEPEPPKTRVVTMRPGSYTAARSALFKNRLANNRKLVEKLSNDRIGYVYVPKMQWNEFIKFEEEIFARGAGKEGLVIDVRDNGGGFTADHLLTVLTPAQHAVTVPRGGGPGYPQDRLVYATWTKPILVLCNQNSFSNAEIFSHAIKELGRGKLVGVPTAGGVISTGATSIMDVGTLRLPFRGWYRKSDGADMELNGAVPDVIVWPEPSDQATGRDRQIEKAVEIFMKDLEAEGDEKKTEFTPASEERKSDEKEKATAAAK
ncbi:MAG: PDZ domain-containing protein, partial [Verrucomicrobiales bacterium]|nr:PDZ domain-containing protein [Verrucomicrobiales bacterium]